MSDYTKTTWVSGGPPGIDAPALNNIETGIDTAHDEIEQAGALWTLLGGDPIRWSITDHLGWSQRFIIISAGRGAHFATSGYFEMWQPPAGTACIGVGGAANRNWTAAGINLGLWEALYYILPVGSGPAVQYANYRVVSYTSDVRIPPNWVRIALHSGDDLQGLLLWDGRYLLGSQSTRQHRLNPPMELWTAATMPPADESFNGKHIFCNGLSNANFNNREYVYYGNQWRLAKPVTFGSSSSYADGTIVCFANLQADVQPQLALGITPVPLLIKQTVVCSARPDGAAASMGLMCRDVGANSITTQVLATNNNNWYIGLSMNVLWGKAAGDTLTYNPRLQAYGADLRIASAAQFAHTLTLE